jgi:hypothetical protein
MTLNIFLCLHFKHSFLSKQRKSEPQDHCDMCVHPFDLLNQLTNLHEILYEHYTTGRHTNAILYVFLVYVLITEVYEVRVTDTNTIHF